MTPKPRTAVPAPGADPAYEDITSLVASGGVIPHISIRCPQCGWLEWFSSDERAERAFAAHLNDERHAAALSAIKEREERIERYRREAAAASEEPRRA